jgi:hypothetical protein
MVLLALFALGAIAVMIAGLHVQTETTTYPPVPRQRDMMAELRTYRAGCEIATALLERSRAAIDAFRQDLELLRSELARSASSSAGDPLALPEDLVDMLLKFRQIDPANSLRTFWLRPEQGFSNFGMAEPDFPARLMAHARELCAVFSELTMGDVLNLLSGPGAPDSPFFATIMNRLKADSAPWIPIQGKTLKTVVAIPESVGPRLLDTILDRLGRPGTCVETSHEVLVVVQFTQGYIGEPRRAVAAGRL